MIGKVWKKQGGTGGGDIVNGIIEQYKASTSTIDANSFVEFVNSGLTVGSDTTLLNTSNSANNNSTFKAIFIDDNKVAILHTYTTGSNDYVVICEINGTTITAGVDTEIGYSSDDSTIVKVDTNKFMIAGKKGSALSGAICVVNGTTITIGSDTTLSTATYAYQYPEAIQLETNKILLLHRNDSNLYGMICTINGTTITAGTDTLVSNSTNAWYRPKATKINNSKFFLAHSYGSDFTLRVVTGTISGSAIMMGTALSLISIKDSGRTKPCVTVSDNKVLVIHGLLSSNAGGIVCTISETTITAGTDTSLPINFGKSTVNYVDVGKYNENQTLITYANYSGSSELYYLFCYISGTDITTSSTTLINNANSYPVSLASSDNKSVVAHKSDNTNKYLNGAVFSYLYNIRESTTKIDGITKTQATTSTAGDVWVLNQ